MGYISNNNLSTTQPHLLLTHCDIGGADQQDHQVITASSGEFGDRKNNVPATANSRWNPTPEQIMTLEELYRNGTRTPTTEQIKEIASKLRKFGRIEGKNVFFWFQNHKARDRLKRRRREGDAISNVRQPHNDAKDSSGGHRVDQTKSCPSFPFQHSKSKPQSQGEINIIDENEYNVLNEEEEESREIRTLNLFPVMEKQGKTDRFIDKKMNTESNQVLGCNYCYYYEFMPLKN